MTERKRPRPRALVKIDPNNAYALLGVSPLASTEEIRKVVSERRSAAAVARNARAATEFGDEEAEMARLQEIEKKIGTPKARAAYDDAHPLSDLLTVQAAAKDAVLTSSLGGGDRSGLASEWLLEELGRDARVPSASSLWLWAPKGVDPATVAELAPFASAPLVDDAPRAAQFAHEGLHQALKKEKQDG